jgi:HK97 family phage prohead protease
MADRSIERRSAASEIELRAEGDQAAIPRIVGYAAVFNQLSDELGGFREQIAPGAFTKSLGGDIRALFNHDPNRVLGRTRSKTLTLREDQKGLAVEIQPPDTAETRALVTAMQRGDVSQMSFGFYTRDAKWEEIDGKIVRTLLEVELFDVSVVTFAAYPQAEAALRSLEQWRSSLKPPETPEAGLLSRMKMRLALAQA